MKCKNHRIRSKKRIKYGYCVKYRKEVPIFCKECNNIEYKQYSTMKSRTYKYAKREKERFSIIYPDLTKCCECGLKTGDFDKRIDMYTQVEKNEVFSGSYRVISMEDGMVAPMCTYCHKLFHKDVMLNLYYKTKFQKEYLKTHSLEDFMARYGQDFIYKLEQKKRGKDI